MMIFQGSRCHQRQPCYVMLQNKLICNWLFSSKFMMFKSASDIFKDWAQHTIVKLIFLSCVLGFITTASFRMPFVTAVEVQLVKFGSTATLACNISYLYETTWLKQNPDVPPDVVLSASLREGQAVQGSTWFQWKFFFFNRKIKTDPP